MKKIVFGIAAGLVLLFAVAASAAKSHSNCKAQDCTCATKHCCEGTVCTCAK